jgi:hypothetical protein
MISYRYLYDVAVRVQSVTKFGKMCSSQQLFAPQKNET